MKIRLKRNETKENSNIVANNSNDSNNGKGSVEKVSSNANICKNSIEERFRDRSLNFFGINYRIKFVDNIDADNENITPCGLFEMDDNIIYVALKNTKGKYYNEEQIKTTLYHELVHMICRDGQYLGYCQDEPFVEWIAKGIRSLEKSGIFKI